MGKRFYSLVIAVLIGVVAQAQSKYYFGADGKFDQKIPTPEEFFGFPIGSALVRYDRVVEYFRLLDKLSHASSSSCGYAYVCRVVYRFRAVISALR